MSESNQGASSDDQNNKAGRAQLAIRALEFLVLHFFWLAAIGLTVLFIWRLPAIFRYESVALDTLLAGLSVSAAVPAAAVIAAIPWVAVCVIATVVTVGTIVVTILGNDPIGWLDREIERLKALCPLFGSTLPWGAWLECRSRLSALRTVYWALVLAAGVTTINILVIYGRLGQGLPPPPVPPPF